MKEIFQLVGEFLQWLADTTGFTYTEINIIVYYIIAPFIFLYQLDKIIGKNYLKIGFTIFVVVGVLLIKDFQSFSNHLFDYSVNFLKWFAVFGLSYIQASVVICVILPIVILIALQYLIIKKRKPLRT